MMEAYRNFFPFYYFNATAIHLPNHNKRTVPYFPLFIPPFFFGVSLCTFASSIYKQ